ncbi:adenylyl cyclase-associated protein [Macrolepiota fuliginosa MF-IS2]|uniref:Adenylyl cyclase-associated protein n=1 Tax=Macrolepiota fuliginosa MF-IS2 TaxID=1400762 RepID=A0A9P5XJX9_9AGAR|nr:adenylyl cyclase-associated protein [Macrolepiota fuliginosa MF-IS2]
MASGEGLHNIATIMKRLEAATSRLEDIADNQLKLNPPTAVATSARSSTAAAPSAPPPPPPPPPAPPAATPSVAVTPSVAAFDENVVAGKIKPWVALSASLNIPLINEIATLVSREYEELRNFLVIAGACQKPDQKTLEDMLLPIQKSIEAFNKSKDSNRRERESFGHLQFASEAAVAVGWVVNDRPAQFVKDVKESSEYYGNRVMKDFKEKDPRHVEWCRGLNGILDAVRDHAEEFYKLGLIWNTSGPTVEQFRSVPPTPPPAPPPPSAVAGTPVAGGGVAAVFAELNRGEEVTRGLRKVDKSEMTHKNPSLRAGSVVPAPSPGTTNKKPVRPTKPASLAGKKPPKFLLDGSKWMIENQENGAVIKVEETSLNQSVNIFNCNNATVVIEGKVNAVNLVRSTKTSVLVNSVVSSISVTASPSFAVQVTGTIPMIQVDNTDSGQIYLSKESLAAEITTAKCSAINVSLPVEEEEDGVFSEHPIPEMLKIVVKDGKLVTAVVEHIG